MHSLQVLLPFRLTRRNDGFLIGAGNNPMVGMTVAVAVSIEEAAKAGKF